MKLPRRLAHGQEVELVGHLEELRSRLFVAGGAVLATTILAFVVHRQVIALLVAQLPPHHRQLLTLGVAEPFTTSLKVSFALGFALALPILLWQLWSFVAPAMTAKTQRGSPASRSSPRHCSSAVPCSVTASRFRRRCTS
jgi:Sec-independent protein secretion pathway component TatC